MTDTDELKPPVNWLNETMYGGISIPPGQWTNERHDQAERHVKRKAFDSRHIVTNVRWRHIDGWSVYYYLTADIHGLRCPSFGVTDMTAFSGCQMPEGHDGEHSCEGEVWDEPHPNIISLAEHSKQRAAEDQAARS